MDNESIEINNLDKNFKLGFVLNTCFTIFEFVIGFFSGSLALISDAAHNLTDSLSIVIAFLANKISKKEANISKTYGYGRATILAALINSLILIALALYIFYEAFQRFQKPEPVEGGLVAIVAFIGILINGGVAFLFSKNRDDLNTKAAFLNMFFDTLASVGALMAGIIILVTKISFVDSLISVLIGFLLLYSSWGVIKSALHVLLEGMPEGINIEAIKNSILAIDNVKAYDDLHIWSLSSQYAALSCHLIIKPCSLQESINITKMLKNILREKYNIIHSTIEVELTEGPHDNESINEGLA